MTRILIVEDNKDVSEMLDEALSLNPLYTTLCAYDGLSAMHSLPDFQPNLILLDGKLPILNGDEVATQIKKNPMTCQIPLVAISGEPNSSPLGMRLRKLCDLSIAKPFSLSMLFSSIEMLLSQTHPFNSSVLLPK